MPIYSYLVIAKECKLDYCNTITQFGTYQIIALLRNLYAKMNTIRSETTEAICLYFLLKIPTQTHKK